MKKYLLLLHVLNAYLNEGLFDAMEEDGGDIFWMPLSEYLCFMWKKRAESKKEKKIVEVYENQMKDISGILGLNSPFSDNPDILFEISQKYLPEITGANAAYRFGKENSCEGCSAVIDAASMYENVQTIFNLVRNKNDTPMLYLNFEGSNDIATKERLNSFLYYIDDRSR
jgi:hypothetical protein